MLADFGEHGRVTFSSSGRSLSRMPQSIPRTLAFVAMFVIALPSAFLAILWWYVAEGVFENSDPGTADRIASSAFLAGFAATLTVIAGLVVGSRSLTAVASLLQGGVVVLLLVLWQSPDYQIGEDDTYFIVGLLCILVVDLVAIAAALVPWPSDAPASARSTVPMPVGSRRKTAQIAMELVAVASLALLLAAASNTRSGHDLTYTYTGVVGLAGALVVLVALRARSRSVALGTAVVQGVLVVILYLWFGFVAVSTFSAVPLVLLGIGIADVLTMRASSMSQFVARS